MALGSLQALKEGLLSVGYREDRFTTGVPLPSDATRKLSLVAYADHPFDARTSSVAAIDARTFRDEDLGLLRPLGAPILAHYERDHVLFFRQSTAAPQFIERVETGKIASFFQANRDELAPSAVCRSKVWGRAEPRGEARFVDTALLPFIEQSSGEDLQALMERAVLAMKQALGWTRNVDAADGRWLLKAVFWLLAAKILRDKKVPGFGTIQLQDLESVFLKLARHYDKHDPRPVQIDGSKRRDALLEAAGIIGASGHWRAVTIESLAWVYESAMVDRETRQKLGTHSTPGWLVDDVVGKLRPWIEEMPVEGRRVFEPACGHGAFLISAMRLLSELLPPEQASERKRYLRSRLRGVEIDSFAVEVARLSLTLADVPNDNGWMLENANMFNGDLLRAHSANADIVLANPPFESFGKARPPGALVSQADETFRQVIDALPVGGVFGFVLPQAILHSQQARDVRRKLLAEYEISEMTLFADKVFRCGQPESVVILGRRVGTQKSAGSVSYRRVREPQVEIYRRNQVPSSVEQIPTSAFIRSGDTLLIPELHEVWDALRHRPKLGDFIDGGQGFQHKGAKDPTLPPGAIRESDVPVTGLVEGFATWENEQLTHLAPRQVWVNLDPVVIRRPLHGTTVGIPQILLNYAPVSREAWRLKTLVDPKGHPVTSRYLVFRPLIKEASLNVLWAICNSPLANAFAYAHSTKRDVLAGQIRNLPVFEWDASEFDCLEQLVRRYFSTAAKVTPVSLRPGRGIQAPSDQLSLNLESEPAAEEEELKCLHWRIDAEVLRLYNLTPEHERQILDLFTGIRRRGVPFVQDAYFPAGFPHLNRLSELLAITEDWEATNKRRCDLIRKDVKVGLKKAEQIELEHLERLADARIAWIEYHHPQEPDELDRTVERLKKAGKWTE